MGAIGIEIMESPENILLINTGGFSNVINQSPPVRIAETHVEEKLRDMQLDCRQYAHEHGVDKPEIREWCWPN